MNKEIADNLTAAAEIWCVEITRTEIVDIKIDDATKEAQRQQLNAERTRRATLVAAEGEKTSIQAVAFSGHEVTYQAWYGIPLSLLNNNSDSSQTYNPYDYDNEVDNYQQSHYQLHFTGAR